MRPDTLQRQRSQPSPYSRVQGWPCHQLPKELKAHRPRSEPGLESDPTAPQHLQHTAEVKNHYPIKPHLLWQRPLMSPAKPATSVLGKRCLAPARETGLLALRLQQV